MKVYLFLGHGGYLFSLGFSAFGDRLAAMGYEVEKFPDSGRDVNRVRADVMAQPKDRPIIMIGYSLGANGCAWNAKACRPREIALVVGFDPTANGPSLKEYMLGPNVKRALCFMKSSAITPDSWFFGGSRYYRTTDGPQIIIKQGGFSHLAIQSDSTLQALTISELKRIA